MMSKQQVQYKASRAGFTLIEILLAMLITSTIVLCVNAAYQQAYRLYSEIETNRPVYHDARLIAETLREELSCLYVPVEQNQEITPFKLLTRPDGAVELQFFTLAAMWRGSPETTGIARIRYVFAPDQDKGNTVVQRFEQPWSGEKPIGQEKTDVVAEGPLEYSLWAFDPNGPDSSPESWRQSYDAKGLLPRAVKVRLSWPASKGPSQISLTYSIRILSDFVVS